MADIFDELWLHPISCLRSLRGVDTTTDIFYRVCAH